MYIATKKADEKLLSKDGIINMPPKIKIYLDTSLISHLLQEDTPDKMNDTLVFWEQLKNNEYDIVLSDLTLDEIKECSEPKQSVLIDYLGQIKYKLLAETDDVKALAQSYIDNSILTQKSMDDCRHIAFATVSGCDIIVSWNFKHMVRYKTIKGVREINAQSGYYKSIDIIHPSILIERG